jgi:hypothetical protein
MIKARPITGVCAIALAILFNVPFAILGSTFDYPDVLRRPAGEVLDLFAAGGNMLILTWHAFGLTALLLAPVAIMLALAPERVGSRPVRAIGAAILGALAGLAQAMGLWRWVFVIPGLARTHADPAASADAKLGAERAFDILNQYGGVAIGEHLGQWLTALFVLFLALAQWSEGRRISALVGFVTAAAVAVGTEEGVAIALGHSGAVFSMATIGGFLGLTVWLIATGVGEVRGKKS